jgi:hypothetical protein
MSQLSWALALVSFMARHDLHAPEATSFVAANSPHVTDVRIQNDLLGACDLKEIRQKKRNRA